MRLKLLPHWRCVLLKAWSERLMVAAGLLSGAEVLLPLAKEFGWVWWMPPGIFALLSFVAVCGGVWARLLVQRNLP